MEQKQSNMNKFAVVLIFTTSVHFLISNFFIWANDGMYMMFLSFVAAPPDTGLVFQKQIKPQPTDHLM